MITPELTNFVTSQRKLAVLDSAISETLAKTGWNQVDIQTALALNTSELTGTTSTPSLSTPNVSPASVVQTTANKNKSITSIVLVLLALLGAILMIVFFAVTFLSGKSIFKSESISLIDSPPRIDKQINLPKSGNPYRVLLTVHYKVLGKPFNTHYDLLSYSYTLQDSTGKSIQQGKKSVSYSASSSDDDSSNFSRSNISASSEVMTFTVPTDGMYTLTMPITANPDIGSDFQLEDFSYEIKANVITLSPIILILGFGLLCASVLGIFVRSKKNKSTVN